jgi:hypothetical protein
MDTNLNYYEQQAVLDFIKKYLTLHSKPFSDINEHYLLTAYNKLQLAIDTRKYQEGFAD